MNKVDKDIWEVMTVMLNGDPSAEERELFDRWLNETKENREFYNAILNSRVKSGTLSHEARERVYERIHTAIQPVKPARRINIWAYAAVASVAILLTLTFNRVFISSKNADRIPNLEAKVPFGVKSKIALPDGSIVYINSGSSVQYPAVFARNRRKVLVKGEAYFEVQKDVHRPFIVETGGITVKVLGTHFNVRNFEDANLIETSLLEGSVEVLVNPDKGKETRVLLSPGQQAVFDKRSRQLTARKVDAELAAIWKDGKYYFDNETFSDIANDLERHFNVKIIVGSDELNNTVFSGLFDQNRTIYQILDVMKSYSRFDYTAKNDTILIKDPTH